MLALAPVLETYVREHAPPEPDVLARLRAKTEAEVPMAQMLVGPVEGALLRLLVRLLGARSVLEIGTFTGYSAISMALAMPPDGRLVTCDVDETTGRIAQAFIDEAGLSAVVERRIGPALSTIAELARIGTVFDLVFIDADKGNYPAYLDATADLVRPGGLVVADNTLWGGHVVRPLDDATRAIARFNEKIAADPRFESLLLPVRDGVTIALRR
ncbi:MAG: methyltransferase [Deltaproteobacteria bacterium]|nr:MAG: methyltransferase [Deltaproteobacteria bacterium]